MRSCARTIGPTQHWHSNSPPTERGETMGEDEMGETFIPLLYDIAVYAAESTAVAHADDGDAYRIGFIDALTVALMHPEWAGRVAQGYIHEAEQRISKPGEVSSEGREFAADIVARFPLNSH